MARALEFLFALGALDENCRLTDPLGLSPVGFFFFMMCRDTAGRVSPGASRGPAVACISTLWMWRGNPDDCCHGTGLVGGSRGSSQLAGAEHLLVPSKQEKSMCPSKAPFFVRRG